MGKDLIIFEHVNRQTVSAQGDGYSKDPGYHIWYQENGVDEWLFIGYIIEEQLSITALYYNREKNIELKYLDSRESE